LKNFKNHESRILIATDIAARGLDISQISHVFNYDLPQTPEIYLHRMGRTGRAGEVGVTISFCANDELSLLKDIQKHIGMDIPLLKSPIVFTKVESAENEPIQSKANGGPTRPNNAPRRSHPGSTSEARGSQNYRTKPVGSSDPRHRQRSKPRILSKGFDKQQSK
jgi:ATP-dependent RNA helicase RhlE